MAILKSIELKGYRSIKEMSLALEPLNVLIGANGAGKSNFISFFKMLNEMMGGRLQQYMASTGRSQSVLHFGPKATIQLEAKLEFEVDQGTDWYHLRLFHAAGDSLIFAEETLTYHGIGFSQPKVVSLGAGHPETKLHDRQDEPTVKTLRRLLSRCRVYHFHDTSPEAKIRLYCYIDDNRWLMPDGGNLAAMLYAYRTQSTVAYKNIESAIRKIVPEFSHFDLEPSRLNPREILLNWRKTGRDYLFGPHQISDGSLRAMALCALLLQPEEDLPNTIILDEPELGLHPQALEIVAGLIRAVSEHAQIIVATQSQTFLNFFDPSEIITVEAHDGRSVFQRLDLEQLKDWLEDYSLGELWQRNVIGAGPMI